MLNQFLIMLASYLLGSIPFALIVVRIVKQVDIRDYGSGNIGATNAYRLMGLSMGILVALLDISKGFLAVRLAGLFFNDPVILLIAGLMAIAGHNWPIFLKFKGGRGVATSVGVLISLVPEVILITFFVWIIIVIMTQYVSLASITGAVIVPILIYFFNHPMVYLVFGLLISGFVIYRHLENIKRLLAGKENKVTLNTGKND